MKKVLIITYYWPPSGGAGVQRWLKMSKYLPEYGIMPIILTVDPEYATYPATDISLMSEIPENLEVHRTKATDYFRLLSRNKSDIPSAGFAKQGKRGLTSIFARFIRGNFFIPDPRIGWNRHAFKKASALIKDYSIGSMVTTGPPHSTHLIGLKLRNKFRGIRWIADFRDPWVDIYYYRNFYPTRLARYADRRYEMRVIRNADVVTVVSNSIIGLFRSKYPDLSDKYSLIRNGYDTEDFRELSPAKPEKLTITYVGTLADAYPLEGFAKALKHIEENMISFKFRLTGYISEDQRQLLENNLPSALLEFNGYRPHRDAIIDITRSSILLLIIPRHESARLIITGKLFEYIASGKPILLIGPVDGEAAEIISSLPNCLATDYDDSSSMAEFICKVAEGSVADGPYLPEEYTRRDSARILSNLL